MKGCNSDTYCGIIQHDKHHELLFNCLTTRQCEISFLDITCNLHFNASIYWYPCSTALYESEGRDADVRAAIRNASTTQEIILHDQGSITRNFPWNRKNF